VWHSVSSLQSWSFISAFILTEFLSGLGIDKRVSGFMTVTNDDVIVAMCSISRTNGSLGIRFASTVHACVSTHATLECRCSNMRTLVMSRLYCTRRAMTVSSICIHGSIQVNRRRTPSMTTANGNHHSSAPSNLPSSPSAQHNGAKTSTRRTAEPQNALRVQVTARVNPRYSARGQPSSPSHSSSFTTLEIR